MLLINYFYILKQQKEKPYLQQSPHQLHGEVCSWAAPPEFSTLRKEAMPFCRPLSC